MAVIHKERESIPKINNLFNVSKPMFYKGVVTLAERKAKRDLEVAEVDHEECGFIIEPKQVEVGSGYTISVDYDENEKQIINVKTYGEVDVKKIRKEIERVFPNAHIRQLNQVHSVAVVKKRKKKK
jgi:hypothetical protein